jgi:conjugal transfer mating pair stabilization protein TraG
MSLVWIQLWPPLYAILNYVGTLASARNLAAAARMGSGAQGLTLDTAASIYQGAISDLAIAGYMVAAIPIIATAIIKGGEVAFQAVTASSAIQSAAANEAASATKGLVTQDSVSFDQQQLAPTRTSAFMASTTDARGTTIQGSGPDAGVFRYQASLSRLASTFTVTERQATALSDSAREAESFATTQREAMQHSQATAMTHALGIQDSFEKSQQRTGASSTSEGGSTSSQFQHMNSVAKEVNRRLGLNEDSTVGKTIAATASIGVKIPLTEIGAEAKAEGRSVDQQRLLSAYDYARKAAETTQLSNASALLKDFRSSDAYQWARGSRTSSTQGYDSSSREASERQSSSDSAYGRAKELARTAQFMREWGSGTQTDFTNYAARRLAERGLLREEDPIKMQRAVAEIAYSYARGGSAASGYVPTDSPFGPSQPLPEAIGWSSPIRANTTTRSAVATAMRSPTRPTATTPRSEPVNPEHMCSTARRSKTTSQAGPSRANGKQRAPSRRGAVRCRRMPARSAKTTAPPFVPARSTRNTAATRRFGTRSGPTLVLPRSVDRPNETRSAIGNSAREAFR